MTTIRQIQRALRRIDDLFIAWIVRYSRSRRIAARTLVSALAAAIALLATTSTAFAYWTAHGSGTGNAAAGTVSLTIPATATASGPLYPGAANVPATALVTNASTNASLTLTSVNVSTSLAPTGCSVTFTPGAVSDTLSHGQSQSETVGTFTMGLASPNSCKSTTFTVGITVSAKAG
jgi:hypothetical protein